MALMGEGVRVLEPATVGDIEVTSPKLHLGRENRDLLEGLLQEAGFPPLPDAPAWMASAATPRPVFFATTPWVPVASAGDAYGLLSERISTVLAALALANGGEPRTIASILEMHKPGEKPRLLAAGIGNPPHPISQLQRLAPDGVIIPTLDPEQVRLSFASRPRIALWTRLFAPIAGEGQWDLRVLRLCSLLEGIGNEVVKKKVPLMTADGTPLKDHGGLAAKTDKLRSLLYVLVHTSCSGLGIPESMFAASPGADLWSEVGVWTDFRNIVGHDGRWLPSPAFSGLVKDQARSEAAAQLAARGGNLDEGLVRYADCIMAATELVLRYAVAGGLDSLV
jgi:hypothetical protein